MFCSLFSRSKEKRGRPKIHIDCFVKNIDKNLIFVYFTMKLFSILAGLFTAAQVPTGNYVGSKTLFGETINAVVNIQDAECLDFAISGDFTLDCKDEHYSLNGNTIVLDDIDIVGDCAHDALVDNQITLKSIVYDDQNNQITVSVKYSIVNVDIVLYPQALLITS
jgi:hypothetical protein